MRVFFAFCILAALGGACLAAEITVGATMQVKANSMWFEEADQLAQ